MIAKPIGSIDIGTLESLRTNEVIEGKTIEYKRALPGDSPEERRKLLRSIVSFANTTGGDLLYGVEAKRAVPTAFPGIELGSLESSEWNIGPRHV